MLRWLACTVVLLTGCGRLRFEDLSGRAQGPDAALVPMDAEPSTPDVDASSDGAGASPMLDAQTPQTDAEVATSDAAPCPPGSTGQGCQTCVRYVDVAAPSQGADGLSWATAFPRLIAGGSSAIDAVFAPGGPDYCEVWVREGRYYTYESTPIDGLPLSPALHFIGGFAGTERDISERDHLQHTSIIDGANPSGTARSYRAVYGSNGGFLDGFTITSSVSGPGLSGGGIDLQGGASILRNLVLQDHDVTELDEDGAALRLTDGASAVLENSHLAFNRARSGGAIAIRDGALEIRGTSFLANAASSDGAAIYASDSSLTVDGAFFAEHSTDGSGGVIAFASSTLNPLTLRRVTLRGGRAGGNGGCLSATGSVQLSVENLVAQDCEAGGQGGALYITGAQGEIRATTLGGSRAGSTASGAVLQCAASCVLRNAILWNPSTLSELSRSGPLEARYSLVRGGTSGTAILTADPQFVATTILALSAGSPAIDAAEGCAGPELDTDLSPRYDTTSSPNTGAGPVYSDMGAYEYTENGTEYPAFSEVCP